MKEDDWFCNFTAALAHGEEAAWHAGAVSHTGGTAAISQPALKQAGTLLDGTTTFLAHPPHRP